VRGFIPPAYLSGPAFHVNSWQFLALDGALTANLHRQIELANERRKEWRQNWILNGKIKVIGGEIGKNFIAFGLQFDPGFGQMNSINQDLISKAMRYGQLDYSSKYP